MAGHPLGASAPFSPTSPSTDAAPSPASCQAATADATGTRRAPLRLVASTTRRRRNHGVFLVGNELACIYSSRREFDGLGVTLELGAGSVLVSGAMTPTQARLIARSLTAAAEAAEATAQRREAAQGSAA